MLITYIRATGMQYFVKAPKKPSGWQSTMGAQTASSLRQQTPTCENVSWEFDVSATQMLAGDEQMGPPGACLRSA